MPTVFVTNKSPQHDYDSAMQYGALRFVTQGNYPIFKTARLQEEIVTTLIHSQPEDYLVLSGSAMIAAICMHVWMEMHGRIKALVWDSKQYMVRELSRQSIRLDI